MPDSQLNSRGCVKLGSWVCPSGNSVDVYLDQDAMGRYHVLFFWDEPPPFLPEDRTYYFAVIRPEVIQRSRAITGLSGSALVITIE
jgi:hypothetical protein